VGVKGQTQGGGGWRLRHDIDLGTGNSQSTWQDATRLAVPLVEKPPWPNNDGYGEVLQVEVCLFD
jgi:hypothetical protein